MGVKGQRSIKCKVTSQALGAQIILTKRRHRRLTFPAQVHMKCKSSERGSHLLTAGSLQSEVPKDGWIPQRTNGLYKATIATDKYEEEHSSYRKTLQNQVDINQY